MLFLKWGPSVNYKDQAQYFNVTQGQTLAARPVATANGGMFGIVGVAIAAMAAEGKPGFEYVDLSGLGDLLKSKHLSSVSSKEAALFHQK